MKVGVSDVFYDVFGQLGSIIVRHNVTTNPTCQEQREARAENKRKLAEEAAKPKKRGRPPKGEKQESNKKAGVEGDEGDGGDFSMEEELEKKDQVMKTERELDDKDESEKPGRGRGRGRGKGDGRGHRLRARKVVKERTAASKASPKKKDPEEHEETKDISHMHAVCVHDCAHVHQLPLLARTFLHLRPSRFKVGISISHFVLPTAAIITLHAGPWW